MTIVDLENKVENLMAKKEELLNNKEIFKVNMDKIFSDFKNISFIPYFENIRSEVNNKFNDYIVNAETKLKKYDESVKNTLKGLKNEIEEITKNSENSLKVKYEDLKTKINLEKEKIQGLMIINNDIFREFKLINTDIKNNDLQIIDITKPMVGVFAGIATLTGIFIGIIEGVGIAECMALSMTAGCAFGGIGAFAGGLIGLIGFGAHKLYKEFNKKEEVMEKCKKAQKEFMNQFESYYSQAKNTFEEDKKKIVDNICNGIDNYIIKMETALNEINKI
jgi:Sec-independent protein translocase protein TatA